jgi:hypothetical protein
MTTLIAMMFFLLDGRRRPDDRRFSAALGVWRWPMSLPLHARSFALSAQDDVEMKTT